MAVPCIRDDIYLGSGKCAVAETCQLLHLSISAARLRYATFVDKLSALQTVHSQESASCQGATYQQALTHGAKLPVEL